MPRSGGGVYSLPAGSTVSNGDVSDASDLNTPLADIAADLNVARPIVAGGTGATNAADARTNLGTGVAGLEFIATQDASASATLDFTGFNSARYDGYVFEVGNLIPATDGAFLQILTSADGGANYDTGGSGIYFYEVNRNNEVIPADESSGVVILTPQISGVGVGSEANEDGVTLTLRLPHPHLARRTMMHWEGGYINANGRYVGVRGSGVRTASTATNAIRFLFNTGNIESGTITMYGLRNS